MNKMRVVKNSHLKSLFDLNMKNRLIRFTTTTAIPLLQFNKSSFTKSLCAGSGFVKSEHFGINGFVGWTPLLLPINSVKSIKK